MSKKAVKSHLQYTDSQLEGIETLASMCAHISGCLLEKVSAPFKLMFISGHLRKEDSQALYKHCPFIMNIIVGGMDIDHTTFKFRQHIIPATARQVCDSLIKYEVLIRDEYRKLLEREQAARQPKLLSGAISAAINNS